MKHIVETIVNHYYGCKPNNIESLGGGYYAKVFLASIHKQPYNLVVKVYKTLGLLEREKVQLETLKEYSLIPIPQVYFSHSRDNEIPKDVLVMEYVDGVNAGVQKDLPQYSKENVANKIVDNLIHLHSISCEKGFCEIDSAYYHVDWRYMYKRKAEQIFAKAEELKKQEKLSDKVFKTMEKAMINFEGIFTLPIRKVSLIHGDYNTWNILLKRDLSDVIAVIDPYNCCWGDAELDLYQLNNANGKELDLLNRYLRKSRVSGNFSLKLAFYELFTEVMHYYDAKVDPVDSELCNLCIRLEKEM